MTKVRSILAAALACALVMPQVMPAVAAASEPEHEPSLLHGVGQVMSGVVFQFPKTVLEATLDGPPVVGTFVGVLAGVARAAQVTVAGMVEMGQGFNPWGSSIRKPRPLPRHR